MLTSNEWSAVQYLKKINSWYNYTTSRSVSKASYAYRFDRIIYCLRYCSRWSLCNPHDRVYFWNVTPPTWIIPRWRIYVGPTAFFVYNPITAGDADWDLQRADDGNRITFFRSSPCAAFERTNAWVEFDDLLLISQPTRCIGTQNFTPMPRSA